MQRREVIKTIGGGALAAVSGSSLLSAQTPVASPVPAFDPLANTVPTVFGDVAVVSGATSIVAITDGAVDSIFALDVTPSGVTKSSNGETIAEYLVPSAPADLVYVGSWGELDVEAIVGIAPDAILADRYLEPAVYEQLSAIAPTFAPTEIDIALDEVDGLQQWEHELLTWGAAIGQYDRAAQAVADARAYATALQTDLGEHAGESVVVFRPQTGFPVVMSGAWNTGRVLSWTGLTNPEFTASMEPPHSGDTVSLEAVNLLEADWFFLATRDQEMVDAIASTYLSNPLFQTLSPYATGQIAQVDGALWSGATGVLASRAMVDTIRSVIVDGVGIVEY